MRRRTLLKQSLNLGLTATLFPVKLLSAYPGKAFLAKEIPDALRETYGTADIGESDKIEIDAPLIASDGNLVPVRVKSRLPNTESISIVVTGNAAPFTAFFKLYEAQDFVSTRVRMSDDGDLLVVVKADGVLHANKRPVRVGNHSCGV